MKNGFVYAASGEKFIAEAVQSAHSVRRHHPDAAICLISDREVSDKVFTEVHVNPEARGSGRDKLDMDLCPYDRAVFLDTDTMVTGNLSELFELLERYDLAVYQETSGYHYKLPDVPYAFPEFNSGVIAFRRTPEVLAFFEDWKRLYVEMKPESGRHWDQPSFRRAVYLSTLRVACLPPEFNVMPYNPAFLMTGAKILHGRTWAHLERLEKWVNAQTGPRVYVPKLGCVGPVDRMSLGKILRLWAAFQVFTARQLIAKAKQLLRR